jgi:mannose-6-phosphate isomerase-like protein (cupin superfamily)
MARAGEAFENPVTGERMVFGKTGRDTNGALLEIEFLIPPNMRKGFASHFHPYFDERFEIVNGSARYMVGKDERATQASDVFVLPRSIAHVHPWNVGSEVLHYRKITLLDKPDLQWLLETEQFFESLYALAQQGKIGNDGLPKNLLQKVVLVQSLQPHTYAAGIPVWVQRVAFGFLAAIGRAVGYKSYYPAQYVLL